MKAIKNNILHRRFIRLFSVILLSLFMSNNLQAQSKNQHIWGIWDLDTIEITKQGVTEKYSIESLLADKVNIPRNMFTRLFFFDDQIGISSTEEIFAQGEYINQKGSFTIEDGKLIVTIGNEQTRTFKYTVENEFLKIEYTRGNTEFKLIYKLYKNAE